MTSREEVIAAVCVYISLCVVFSIIYIFTGSERFSVDFLLKLNETGNLSFSL